MSARRAWTGVCTKASLQLRLVCFPFVDSTSCQVPHPRSWAREARPPHQNWGKQDFREKEGRPAKRLLFKWWLPLTGPRWWAANINKAAKLQRANLGVLGAFCSERTWKCSKFKMIFGNISEGVEYYWASEKSSASLRCEQALSRTGFEGGSSSLDRTLSLQSSHLSQLDTCERKCLIQP